MNPNEILSYEDLKLIIKYIAKESKIKPQKLLCYRTKQLTLIGTITVIFFLTQVTTKLFQKIDEIKHGFSATGR